MKHEQEKKEQTHRTGSDKKACISEVRTGTELAHTLLKKQRCIFSLAQLTHSLLCSQTAAKTHCLFTLAEQGQIYSSQWPVRCPSAHRGPSSTSEGSHGRRVVRHKNSRHPQRLSSRQRGKEQRSPARQRFRFSH